MQIHKIKKWKPQKHEKTKRLIGTIFLNPMQISKNIEQVDNFLGK